MRRAFLAATLACLAASSSSGSATDIRHAKPVDVALVLAIDISWSISEAEHRLQMEGYARAFRDRAVVKAVEAGAHGVIAVAVVEWADTAWQIVRIDWTPIRDAASAEKFAAQIAALTFRPGDENGTAIGGAIDFAHRVMEAVPYRAERRVIDVSGDGVSACPAGLAETRESACAVGLTHARARAIAAGITINGLPICQSEPCEVQTHYAERVIGGPGSFMVVADGYASFPDAIRKKLVLEISSRYLAPSLDDPLENAAG